MSDILIYIIASYVLTIAMHLNATKQGKIQLRDRKLGYFVVMFAPVMAPVVFIVTFGFFLTSKFKGVK